MHMALRMVLAFKSDGSHQLYLYLRSYLAMYCVCIRPARISFSQKSVDSNHRAALPGQAERNPQGAAELLD